MKNASTSNFLLPCVWLWAIGCIGISHVFPQDNYPTLEFRKWSGSINVPDPVAVSVDHRGVVYATQTRRRKVQDLDIRDNRDWIPDDVGLQSVSDKQNFFRTKLAIGGDDNLQKKIVADHNKDGRHDWRDLTVISERVYELRDRDQNKIADSITVFADDFRTEVTGIAAGVMAFEGNVYTTIAPDLWKLTDLNDDGVADSKVSIAHGFGLHIAFGGHDMHGLTVGPDGKIYWSIGDKGIHVTSREGKSYRFPNQGGVMRCNPDGSDFEVFAHGLRNVQEFAFDPYGNIFGIDNDSDQPNERERFVYIVDDMDAGWRCHYQYRGESYNPWTEERLWETASEWHPAYIIPPISYYIDGPAGFKFNPGTALSPEYRNHFFATSAPNGFQFAFRVEPFGDSFRMRDSHQIGSGMAIVGLAFGPEGSLYGADWDGGYPMDEKGSIIRIDLPESHASLTPTWRSLREEVRIRLASGFHHVGDLELLDLLRHADQRVRMGAQFEFVKRKKVDLLLAYAVNTSNDIFGRLHAIWGLGQLLRSNEKVSLDPIENLLSDADASIRAQTAKTLGESRIEHAERLLPLLNDPSLHVQTLAGLALARKPTPRATSVLIERASRLSFDTHYVRHALVLALSRCATTEELSLLVSHPSEMVRLCAVLALRRQSSDQVSHFLKDRSPWVQAEAVRAIHDDDSIPAALPRLAQAIEQDHAALKSDRMVMESILRRMINANFRLGDNASLLRLLQFAVRQDIEPSLRVDALEALATWLSPPKLDRVEGIRRDLSGDRRTGDTETIQQSLSQIANSNQKRVRAAAIAAARHWKIRLSPEVLFRLAIDEENDDATRIEALQSLSGSNRYRAAIDTCLSSKSMTIRVAALDALVESAPIDGARRIEQALRDQEAIPFQQTAIRLFPKIPSTSRDKLLRELGEQLSQGTLASDLALDVAEQLLAYPTLNKGLNFDQKLLSYTLEGGDPLRGEKLFRTHGQAQCVRCHRVGPRGSEIGPELTVIGKVRDAEYLQRALLKPSADIDSRYRTSLFVLSSGQVLKGLLQKQDKKETVIADAEGKLVTLATEDIEESKEQKVSLMPEMTEVLTPREIRDLVAFLRSLR